ncbi:MAG: hypothetical protein ACTHJN_17795, partial [Ginsengibacter sp.]
MNNKLSILLFLALSFLINGCVKDLSNDAKHAKSPSEINFTVHDLFPEGVAYDPVHKLFLVSSAATGSVGAVTFEGAYNPLITDEKLTSTTGLKVDKARKRLLVCNVADGIASYDLNNGNRLFFTDLSSLIPGGPVFINDETFDTEGNLYVTNSASPVIYKVDLNGNASVFYQNSDFATGPADFGFNGIQYDQRGFLLVTHTALNQVIKIPVKNPGNFSVVQLDIPLTMPDGLLLSKDGKQI